jgi:hypothetical protein
MGPRMFFPFHFCFLLRFSPQLFWLTTSSLLLPLLLLPISHKLSYYT